MSEFDYYIIDVIYVYYNSGTEDSDILKILRSKQPRKVGALRHGQSKAQWIDENEELMTRLIYDDGIWNVKDWESALYISELSEYNISIDTVLCIKRISSYVLS